ncbi:MAG: hypothetical protein H0V54_14725 [Chthoniobacterales bacterium]|nr:hypothetical protein [Chthoniobacterales bacterium]
MPKTYYPDQNDDRADWWQNVIDQGSPIFTALALPAAQITSIMADAAWGVYLYRTLRVAYEEATTRVIGYADAITDGGNGTPAPAAPAMPTWPAAPATAVDAGIEARREMWVQSVKSNPAFNAGTMGTTLRLEATATPFNPSTYMAKLDGLSSPAAKQLRFKFGKSYGRVDGVNLYGRKSGQSAWVNLGRFNATRRTRRCRWPMASRRNGNSRRAR